MYDDYGGPYPPLINDTEDVYNVLINKLDVRSGAKDGGHSLQSVYENGTEFRHFSLSAEFVWNVSIEIYKDGDSETPAIVRDVPYTATKDGVGWWVIDIAPNEPDFLPPDDGETYSDTFSFVFQFAYYITPPDPKVGELLRYNNTVYTIMNVDRSAGDYRNYVIHLCKGIPIKAVWGTIADDDGSAHYYKKLQKKGSLVALMPMSDSGVKAWVIKDEEDPIFVGETDSQNHILPFNYYLKKKVKKYKRLQIVVENDSYGDGFGVDEIIKCYTVGNYAKK